MPPGFNLLDFVLYNLLLPCLGFLVVGWTFIKVGDVVRPRVAAWWAASTIRAGYRAVGKGQLIFVVAAGCNALAALLMLPLLRVPPGSGVKPMGQIFFSLVLNVAAFDMCRAVARDPERVDGSGWLAGAGAALCLTPFIGAVALMHLIAWLRGLQFG